MALACVLAAALACERPGPGARPDGTAPLRIVSLGRELGSVLVEMGLAAAVVGADSPSRALPELAHARDLGDPRAPSLEAARAAEPDLVLVLAEAASRAAGLARTLASEGAAARVFAPRDANEVIASIHDVGRLVGREKRAARLAARLTREVAEIATRRDGRTRHKVAWLLAREPLVAVGGTGLLHEVLELAGAENAFHGGDAGRVPITPGELAASAPDLVLAPPSRPSQPFRVPAVPGARIVAIEPALAELPLLDLAARVRALHAVLYPRRGPS